MQPSHQLLAVLGIFAIASSDANACESAAATNVFALARRADAMARAVVAQPEDGPAFLIVLETYRGVVTRGSRIEWPCDPGEFHADEEVLVFANRVGALWQTAAGARACVRNADRHLAPALALYAQLTPAEQASFLATPWALEIGARCPRWQADLNFERPSPLESRAHEQTFLPPQARSGILAAVRQRMQASRSVAPRQD